MLGHGTGKGVVGGRDEELERSRMLRKGTVESQVSLGSACATYQL